VEKETALGAVEFLRDFNAHQAKVEQLRDQAGRELLLAVHLLDERADFLFGELLYG